MGNNVVSLTDSSPILAATSTFDKDIEILKITLISEELRAGHFARLGFWLSFLIAVFAGDLVLFGIKDTLEVLEFVAILTAGALLAYSSVSKEAPHYRLQLSQLSQLLGTVEGGKSIGDFDMLLKKFRELGDFESRMKDDKPKRAKRWWLKYINFGLGCFALSAILFSIQFVLLYFQSVINGNSSTYVATTVKSLSSWVDWTAGVLIAVFFGGLMIGALILVIPWDVFEKTRAMRRAKSLIGLSSS